MASKATHPAAAVITVRDANTMTPRGRKAIAAWMRQQARFLEQHGNEFSRRFTAHYMYR